MKQWIKRYLPLLLALLLCVGCGKASGGSGEGENGGNSSGVVTTEGASDSTYRVDKTIFLEIEDPDTDFSSKTVYSGAYGSTLYLLASYQFEDGADPAMWIYTFDLNTLETEKVPFSLETPGMENPYVDSMTVTGQDELTLRLYGALEGSSASSYLYRADPTGKPLDEETPFTEDTEYPPLFGRFVAVPDGTPFLAETGDSMTTSLSRYDAQSQRPVSLVTVSGYVNALCSDGQGGLYYVDSARLRHLSLDDMTEEILCNIAESGIKLAYDNWLLSDGKGKLALCSVSDSAPTVYLLTNQEETPSQAGIAERETIRMVRLESYNYIVERAYNWSALSDNYSIVVEEIPFEEEKDMTRVEFNEMLEPLRTRIMAEIVSGKGPELMYVSEDDMHILAEKGALMDLSELIPEDIEKQLLPGMRPMGTVDGTWVGITQHLYYYTLMTADSLWSEDSWTVSGILDLAESRDDWDWIMSASWFDAPTDYNALFERVFSMSLGDSPFMDVENGISYFNGEEFIRTLELCKRYGQSGGVTVGNNDAIRAMVQEGKGIARMLYFFGGLNEFSEAVTRYENCHIVGFPGEKGSGNYMYSPGYLVVNANAEHVDAIKDFITYILDYEEQFRSSSPVRGDVLRDNITVHPQTGEPAILCNLSAPEDSIYYIVINDLKPDGTTYIEEYMDFIESCEPVPYCPDAIRGIVQEEIGAYFTGDKSAKDTADIIHRRVQLYFDER
ncbi:MAG: extracellular solute-binding protein [Acetatifactor sp.]|nr:extracellular solute-binding protein [Acetatifactor sp.]